MINLKTLLILLIDVTLFHSCQSLEHDTVQFYSNINFYEAEIGGEKVLVLDEKMSWCTHRSYHYGLDFIGKTSEWTDVSIYNCFHGVITPYEAYLDDNTFFEKVRLELVRQSGQGD